MKNIDEFLVKIDSGRANLILNKSIYSVEAINSASYELIDKYNILITHKDNDELIVIFETKSDHDVCLNDDIKQFINSLLDHQIRLQLDKKYGKIRDLIVEHAFSPLDLKNKI